MGRYTSWKNPTGGCSNFKKLVKRNEPDSLNTLVDGFLTLEETGQIPKSQHSLILENIALRIS